MTTGVKINKTRYDFIDYAKAISITLIVLTHTTAATPISTAFPLSTFFFIGGMFAKSKNTNLSTVISKGFNQLIVPYFIMSTFAFSTCWISPYLHPEIYYGFHNFYDVFKGAFVGMFLMQDRVTTYSFMPCGPLWFLPALFWCRLLFYAWGGVAGLYKYLIRIVVVVLLLTIYLYKFSLFSLSSVAVSFPIFLCGYYLKDFVVNKLAKLDKYILGLVALLAFVVVYYMTGDIGFDAGIITGNIFLTYTRCLMGALCIFAMVIIIDRLHITKLNSLLSNIGCATIVILGFHGYFIILFKILYSVLGGDVRHIIFSIAILMSLINVFLTTEIYHKILLRYLPASVGEGNFSFTRLKNSLFKH